MMKYEKDNPQTAPLLQAFAKALLTKPAAPPPGIPERLSYYKCNMNSIVGDGETIPWPLCPAVGQSGHSYGNTTRETAAIDGDERIFGLRARGIEVEC